MSDWADEKAFQVAQDIWNEPPQDTIAAALRQARIEALEEAALIAEGRAESDRWASVDFEVDATFSCEQVAERIRALKDKQP